MFQYRQVLERLRALAAERGWLDLTNELPDEAAQVDFGAGRLLAHPDSGPRRSWASVTLAHSRHQHVEFVWDQLWPPGWAATAAPSSGSPVCLPG